MFTIKCADSRQVSSLGSKIEQPWAAQAVIAVILIGSLNPDALAVDRFWSNPGGTDPNFNDTANWTTGIVPVAGDTANFNGPDSPVRFQSNVTNLRAIVNDAEFTFDLNGNTYLLTTNNFPESALTVGQLAGDDGILNLTDGTLSTNRFTTLGIDPTSKGTLNVGAGATLNTWVIAGYLGEGILNVTDGGTVGAPLSTSSILQTGYSTGGIGRVTVDGTGSSLSALDGHFIGRGVSSTGEVTVKNNATLAGGATYIAYGNSSNGTLRIENNALVTGSTAYLGYGSNSNATLNIESGADLSHSGATFYAAFTSGSVADIDVTGAGSTLGAGFTYVGYVGTATLDITDQAIVSNTWSYVGHGSAAMGTVTVDNSQWNVAGEFRLGNSGKGFLTVENGGNVTTGGPSNLASYIGLGGSTKVSTATIRNAGSSWDASGFLELRDGILNVEDQATVTTGQSVFLALDASEANITGTDSLWDIGADLLSFGDLNVTAGRKVQTGTYVNNQGGGQIIVDNGTIDVDSYFVNIGDLTVTGGGTIDVGDYFDARFPSDTAISGIGSVLAVVDHFINHNGSSGSFDITDGGNLTVGVGSIYSTSTLNVAANGASLTSNSEFYVGGHETASSGNGVLNINPGGSVNVATNLKIWSGGNVNLNGGTLNLLSLELAGGMLNHNAGLLHFTQDFTIGTGGPYTNYSLNPQQALTVHGTATIDALGSLTLDGGTFTTGNFLQVGVFNFNTGTFNLTDSDMSVGAGGLFGDNVVLSAGQIVNVTQTATIADDGVLTLNNGRFSAWTIVNDGDIILNGSSSRLGGALTNNNLLRGDGRVDATLDNTVDGEVRVNDGESMRFTGATNTNAGRIESIGGEIEFDGMLVNEAGNGSIVGRNTRLRFDGGLENQAGLGLSFGLSDVFGDIDNTSTGLVAISGGSDVTFYDDFINNGTTQVSAGSTAVYFGGVSGTGSFTGSGTVFFEGDLAPGNSEGLLTIAGDSVFGLGNVFEIEIAGLERGVEYDALNVGGTAMIAGTLDVTLLNGFQPQYGNSFDLIWAGTLEGDFSALILPGLTNSGLHWQTEILLNGTGSDILRLSAVPLPTAVWLLASALGFLGRRNRRDAVAVH